MLGSSTKKLTSSMEKEQWTFSKRYKDDEKYNRKSLSDVHFSNAQGKGLNLWTNFFGGIFTNVSDARVCPNITHAWC